MFAEKALRDLEAWKRLWTLRTTGNIQRKTHTTTPPPLPQLLIGNGFGPSELEKGQRWGREKHRWLSDGLALSDPDSPTQSQHLRGHFHEASKIGLPQQFQPPARKMVNNTFILLLTNILFEKESFCNQFPCDISEKNILYCVLGYICSFLVSCLFYFGKHWINKVCIIVTIVGRNRTGLALQVALWKLNYMQLIIQTALENIISKLVERKLFWQIMNPHAEVGELS